LNIKSKGIFVCRRALSAHRASTMLLTCVAILAVDFHAFPRRFAKAETFGTGLMDAGVGSIVVSTAFAAGARGKPPSKSRTSSHWRRILRLGALLALGVGRVLATQAVDYQSHVGEYGLHWNFFITLAALRAVMFAVPSEVAASPLVSGILGVGVLVAHQSLLTFSALGSYIHTEERGADLISANKEGIFSLPGYVALHLLGCACGAMLHQVAAPGVTKRSQRLRLGVLLGGLWVALYACSWAVEPPSRRSCNAAYVLWMLALNAQSFVLLAACLGLVPSLPLPWLLEAMNDTMLPSFLAANVLTGVVNLGMDTMAVGNWGARGVVGVYMVVVSGAAVVGQRVLHPPLRRSKS